MPAPSARGILPGMDARDRERLASARSLLRPCRVCPRNCRVDRPGGERGRCGIGADPVVSSAGPHFGEEPPLVGRGGSGTIFLAGCNLLCSFCQNYDISHVPAEASAQAGGRRGETMSPADLAGLMRRLESRGCHNINFVTPTHVMPHLLEAILLARDAGLTVPVVWNCGGYESVEALRLLARHVEIYMPDAKFMNADSAERYLAARDYPERMRAAILEMQRQVGDLVIDGGVATRGLLVRHLVMPGHGEDSRRVIDFLAEVSPRCCVNVMGQYRPLFRADEFPEINRRPLPDEVAKVKSYALKRGLRVDA